MQVENIHFVVSIRGLYIWTNATTMQSLYCTCLCMFYVLCRVHCLVCWGEVSGFINPWHVCAGGLLQLGLCVCLLSHISPLKHLFIPKILSRTCTQQTTKVHKFVGFSLKPLRSSAPSIESHMYSRQFTCG